MIDHEDGLRHYCSMRFTRQHLAIIIIALSLIGTISWLSMGVSQGDGPKNLWFYDLNTGSLFVGDVALLPPTEAPSGELRGAPAGTAAGVLASVIKIEGQDERKIVFLQKYQPDIKAAIASARENTNVPPADYEKIRDRTLVARPPAKAGDPIQWFAMSSPDGQKIITETETLADGKPYATDLPK
jgi:hypothetical protein